MFSGMTLPYPPQKAGMEAFTESPPMLTDTQCRTAKPRESPYKLPDGKGLYLEIKPNVVKAWR